MSGSPVQISNLPAGQGVSAAWYRRQAHTVVNTATRTLAAADDGRILVFESESAQSVTVPAGLPAGFTCVLVQGGEATAPDRLAIQGVIGESTLRAQHMFGLEVWGGGPGSVITITRLTAAVYSVGGDLQVTLAGLGGVATAIDGKADIGQAQPIARWSYADTAARDAATYTAADIGYVARVASPLGFWRLAGVAPLVWEQIGGASPAPASLWTPNHLAVAPSLMLSDQFVAAKNGVRSWDHDPSRPSGLRFAPRGDAQAPLRMSRRGMDVVRFERVDGHALECSGAAALGLARSVQHGFALFVYRKTEADDLFHCLLSVFTGGASASRFVVYAGGPGHGNRPLLYARRLDADADGILRDTADRGTDWQIVLAEMAWATGVASITRNGASTGVSATITSGGSTSNTDSARPIAVGALSDGSLFFSASIELHAVVARFSDAALTTDERHRLFGWAAHRYALADLLPADHPFRSAPPTV